MRKTPLLPVSLLLALIPTFAMAGGVSIQVNGATLLLTDVPSDAWYAGHVQAVAEGEVMQGYRDSKGNPTGLFGPANTVTRAEFLKMVAVMMVFRYDFDRSVVPTGENWYEPYLKIVQTKDPELPLIMPLDAASLGQPILRHEAAGLIHLSLGNYNVSPPNNPNPFPDVTSNTPNFNAITELHQYEVITGDGDTGTFHPYRSMNRAEAAKILVSTASAYQTPLGTTGLSNPENAYRCNPNPPTAIFPAGNNQVGNPAYCPNVQRPAWSLGKGPRVLFDEGHHNFGTISPSAHSPSAGRSYALGELLRADGFVVTAHDSEFTAETLEDYDILILSHALVAPYSIYDKTWRRWVHNPAAFENGQAYTNEEVAAVKEWVQDGGALLINVEHIPFTTAMSALSEAFGITLDPQAMGGTSLSASFTKSTPSHPIFHGTSAAETIESVPFIAGGTKIQSTTATDLFAYPALSPSMHMTNAAFEASFAFAECNAANKSATECEEFSKIQAEGTTTFDASGDVVAVTNELGRGRVALFTEFATFSSQLIDDDNDGIADHEYGGLKNSKNTGLRSDTADATQLILNTLHWLARKL